jgi:bifunctional UDP-N-acetylglucosamine pyrophosphorylase/glucosamine-1-phosphate N-acetyltransferase
VGVLHDAGYVTDSMAVEDPMEASGVNDRAQLALAEGALRRRINEAWMRAGVTMWDPEHTYVDVTVDLDADVCLLPGTMLCGTTTVGAGARIGPDALLEDCVVGEGARLGLVRGQGARVGNDARVESFSVLRPGAVIAPGALVGFGEVVEA